MIVLDFLNEFEVNDTSQLFIILETRHKNDANSFWLSKEQNSYPKLAILARGDLNTLTYFPAWGGAAFRSIGNIQDNRGGNTIFYLDEDGMKETVPNQLIVLSSTGLKAAEEFLMTMDLPKSIEWIKI